MKKIDVVLEKEIYEHLIGTIPYLLAGLAGNTDGNQLTSVAVQQAGISSWRVVIRGLGVSDSGDPIYVVGFTNGSTPGSALLLAENAYRENSIRWKIDRFSASLGSDGPSKNGERGLSITN